MKHYHYLLLSMASISLTSHAAEQKRRDSIAIMDLSTKIYVQKKESEQELFNLLNYPGGDGNDFNKTHIINIITHPLDPIGAPKEGEYDFRVPKKEVVKQGKLESITPDNLEAIAQGFAAYHYGIKSSRRDSRYMDIGAITIDKDVHYDKKYRSEYLKLERNRVCQAALTRKLNKRNQNKDTQSTELS